MAFFSNRAITGLKRLLLVLGALAPSVTCVAAEKFSVVLIPDPQSYTVFKGYGLYQAQSRWIRDNKAAQNIKHVIYLGDLTGGNEDDQWPVARASLDILDNAGVSYSLFPGNHDYMGSGADKALDVKLRNLAKFNTNFGPQTFTGKSWYGGNMGETTNHNENNYCFFSSGGLDFMVVSLELAPRKKTITWANNLISAHPNHRVIIATHAYLNPGGGYSASSGNDYGMIGARGVDLWEECASRHSNVFMVVCGHVGESMVNTKTGVCGNKVYEMVVDYQFERPLNDPNKGGLGNGWLRLLTFDPDNNKIDASTLTVASGNTELFPGGVDQFYEPDYAHSPTAADHKFSLSYNMGPLAPYTYKNASTTFHDSTVNDVVTGSQTAPDVAQAANGDWAGVWEDDSNKDGIRRILVRGFDADGNERFADAAVNSQGTNTVDVSNPHIAMCPDGRFVVAYQSESKAIMARTYNADGTPTGSSEMTVLSTTGGTLRNPDVAIDDSGNFVVVWEDDADGNGSYQVRAKGYTFSGTQRFAPKAVNAIATGQQLNPAIAMASNGDYVVAWDDDQDSDSLCEVAVRGFLASEQQRFAQFWVNTSTAGQQRNPDVAMDDTGRFVVVWEDDADLNNVYQIKGRGFNATGGEIIPEMAVNLLGGGDQIDPAVAMDNSGNWFAVWEDSRTGEGYQIVSQEFRITGARVFSDDVQVNTVSQVDRKDGTPRRKDPAISVHKSGRYVVAWADDMDGDSFFDVLAKGVTGTACSLVTRATNGSVSPSVSEVFYKKNATVTLTASPSAGYEFVRWRGDVATGSEYTNPLTLTMDADKNLQAVFALPTSGISDWSLYAK